jgi:hypothetical protein
MRVHALYGFVFLCSPPASAPCCSTLLQRPDSAPCFSTLIQHPDSARSTGQMLWIPPIAARMSGAWMLSPVHRICLPLWLPPQSVGDTLSQGSSFPTLSRSLLWALRGQQRCSGVHAAQSDWAAEIHRRRPHSHMGFTFHLSSVRVRSTRTRDV